jgi:hypothetical protein
MLLHYDSLKYKPSILAASICLLASIASNFKYDNDDIKWLRNITGDWHKIVEFRESCNYVYQIWINSKNSNGRLDAIDKKYEN